MAESENVLIIGAGEGLSASLARLCAREGMRVAIVARDAGKLAGLAAETGARSYAADASRPEDVRRLFATLDQDTGPLDLVVYNPSYRARGKLVEIAPEEVRRSLEVTAFGGFLVGQE